MRLSLVLFILCSSPVAFGQAKPPLTERINDIQFMADQTDTDGVVFELNGNVSVILNGISVHADHAEYNTATGELTPSGHVRIQTRRIRTAPEQSVQQEPSGPTDTPLRMPPSPWQEGK